MAAIMLPIHSTGAAALMVYETECQLPPDNATTESHYVTTPDSRGSIQIVWSCLLTLVICVYQVLHLDIPKQKDRQKTTKHHFIDWRQLGRELKWSLVITVAPEFTLYRSMREFRDVRRDLKELHKAAPDTRLTWKLTHMFYVHMGGLIVQHGAKTSTLDRHHIEKAIAIKAFGPEPPISLDEIMDKSKNDYFAKAIAIGQILFFYIDFFARIGQGLSVTQLELGVAGMAFLALLNYACLWHKPKGVQTPTSLRLPPAKESKTSLTAQLLDKNNAGYIQRPSVLEERRARWYESIALLIASFGLGAVHLSAWNLAFPTTIDMWIWRVSSLLVTIIPVPALIFADPDRFDIPFFCFLGGYGVARFGLFVEMFRCLFFLPPKAFQATSWTMGLPHFG